MLSSGHYDESTHFFSRSFFLPAFSLYEDFTADPLSQTLTRAVFPSISVDSDHQSLHQAQFLNPLGEIFQLVRESARWVFDFGRTDFLFFAFFRHRPSPAVTDLFSDASFDFRRAAASFASHRRRSAKQPPFTTGSIF